MDDGTAATKYKITDIATAKTIKIGYYQAILQESWRKYREPVIIIAPIKKADQIAHHTIEACYALQTYKLHRTAIHNKFTRTIARAQHALANNPEPPIYPKGTLGNRDRTTQQLTFLHQNHFCRFCHRNIRQCPCTIFSPKEEWATQYEMIEQQLQRERENYLQGSYETPSHKAPIDQHFSIPAFMWETKLFPTTTINIQHALNQIERHWVLADMHAFHLGDQRHAHNYNFHTHRFEPNPTKPRLALCRALGCSTFICKRNRTNPERPQFCLSHNQNNQNNRDTTQSNTGPTQIPTYRNPRHNRPLPYEKIIIQDRGEICMVRKYVEKGRPMSKKKHQSSSQ